MKNSRATYGHKSLILNEHYIATYPPTDASWTRSASNPILVASEAWEGYGSGDAPMGWAMEPSVLYEGGVFRMWYTGGLGGGQAMGYASCSGDPTVPANWTKYAGNPVLGQGGSGNSGIIMRSSVFRGLDGDLHAYVSNNVNIYHATSTDGLAWSLNPAGVILLADVSGSPTQLTNSHVWQESPTDWRMLFGVVGGSWGDQTAYATSSDGDHWTIQNGGGPLTSLLPGAILSADGPWIIRKGSTYLQWYASDIVSGYFSNVYFATSTDRINWTLGATNPILTRLGPGTFEYDQVTDPCVIVVAGTAYLFYVGANNTGAEGGPAFKIGVASAAAPGGPVFDATKAQDTIAIDRLVIRPQYRDLKEPLHLAQGGTAGRVHKGMLSMQAQGRILVPNATQAASMEDREKALRLAFDPYECHRDSPTTDGVYPLSWIEPTLDATNYPTGWMAVTRYVRPVAQPETEWSVTDQSYRSWAVGLVAPDPRLYDTTVGTGVPYGPVVNKGSIPAPLRVTFSMSGAGISTTTLTRRAPLVNANFDDGLAGWYVPPENGGNVYIDLGTCVLHKTGSVNPEISQVVPATPGDPIMLSLYARNTNSATGMAWLVQWLKADGSHISFSFMDGLTVPTAALGQVSSTSPTAPPLAAYARIAIRNITASSYLVVDELQAGLGPFILDLSGCANLDSVVVTMETCGPFGSGKSITKNGVNAFGLKSSSPTSWLDVPAGSSVFDVNNMQGISSCLLEWAHARP